MSQGALESEDHSARVELLALDEALHWLEEQDTSLARIAELCLFGGLLLEEIAVALGAPAEEVEEDWRAGRAWLLWKLDGGESG